MGSSSLGIFLKVPRAGRVKTRLAGVLGTEVAASLYTAFLEDTVTLASPEAGRHLILHVEGGSAEEALGPTRMSRLREAWGERLLEQRQPDGDLGRRLEAAFGFAERADALPLLVLGSDSPDLPEAHLQRARRALASGADVVLGPADDGGVWCIGLRRRWEGFFDDLPWSSENTGAALRNRADALGLKTEQADPWYDCDEAADLDALRRRLETSPGSAPATRSWLRDRFPSSLPEKP